MNIIWEKMIEKNKTPQTFFSELCQTRYFDNFPTENK